MLVNCVLNIQTNPNLAEVERIQLMQNIFKPANSLNLKYLSLSDSGEYFRFWRIFQILENISDSGKYFRFWRIFQILVNITDSGEYFTFWRIFQILENISDSGEYFRF